MSYMSYFMLSVIILGYYIKLLIYI